MALTRKLLKGMGLTDEQVDTIIEAHTDTVDGLKADISRYKADAEQLPNVQKELDTAKNELAAGKKDSWKVSSPCSRLKPRLSVCAAAEKVLSSISTVSTGPTA